MQMYVHETLNLFYTSKLKRKCPCHDNSHKMRLFGRHSQVYYNNFHNAFSAYFQNRVLLFTEVLPWLSQKQQIKMREKMLSCTTTIATSKPLGNFPQKVLTKSLSAFFNLFCYGAPLKMLWWTHAPYLLTRPSCPPHNCAHVCICMYPGLNKQVPVP